MSGGLAGAAGASACALLAAAVLLWPGTGRVARRRLDPVRARSPGRGGRSASSGACPPRQWLRGGRARPQAEVADAQALAVVEALAIQVRAGARPEAAWQQAIDGVPGLSADLPAEQRLGDRPAWSALAAAWRLSEQTGAPLADVLDRLAGGLRQEAEVDAEVEAALAAPRATARLLAGLPLVGVALGELIGAGPVAVLVGTPLGRVCAVGGLVLAGGGQLWTRSMVLRVVRTARSG
jgi:tight adherence protein B